MKANKRGKQKSPEQLKKEYLETTIMQVIVFVPLTLIAALEFFYAQDQCGKKAGLDEVFKQLTANLNGHTFDCFNPSNYVHPDQIVLAFGVAGLVGLVFLAYYFYDRIRLHNDLDVLKGSSRWNNEKELTQKFADIPDAKNKNSVKEGYNVIFSKNFYASLDTRKHKRAMNTLILGASGSGKTRFWLKPNLLQMNTSYVITDPSGEILASCGEALRRNGYRIKILDVSALTANNGEAEAELHCDSYNPMKYCKQESDIKKLVKAFITNTAETGASKGDQFWDDSMNEFLCACVSFLVTCPTGSNIPYAQIPEVTGGLLYEPCFANLCELTRLANSKWTPDCGIELMDGVKLGDGKNNTANASKLAAIFENMRQYEANRQGLSDTPDLIEKPYALREWENFRIAPEKTSTTVLMVVAVRLGPFNIRQMRDLTSTDTLDLQDFAKQKTALFLKMATNDKTYNFLLSFVYTQLFDILYQFGERQMDGTKMLRLPGNNELVKFYSRSEVNAGIVDEDVKKIKNCHIVHNTERPNGHGKIKQKKKILGLFTTTVNAPVTLHDDWYEIYDEDNRLITIRPTKQAADKFVSELKNAKVVTGSNPRLPIHVRMLIDEFPNIGEIPEYKEKLSTMRKYEISSTTICQTISQLKGMYEKDYEVIDANSPFTIFLGGDENTNNEYISKKIGASTVKTYSQSIDGKKGGSQSYQIDSRELLKPEELGRMDYNDELVLIYGEQPLLAEKYDYLQHPNYKYTNDYAESCGAPECYKFDTSIYPALSTPNLTKRAKINSAIPEVLPITNETLANFFGATTNDEILNKAESYFMNFDINESSATAF